MRTVPFSPPRTVRYFAHTTHYRHAQLVRWLRMNGAAATVPPRVLPLLPCVAFPTCLCNVCLCHALPAIPAAPIPPPAALPDAACGSSAILLTSSFVLDNFCRIILDRSSHCRRCIFLPRSWISPHAGYAMTSYCYRITAAQVRNTRRRGSLPATRFWFAVYGCCCHTGT